MRFSASLDLACIRTDDQNFRVERMISPVQFAPEDAHAAGPAPRIGQLVGIRRIVFVGDVAHNGQDFGARHVVTVLKIFESDTPPRVSPHPVVF